jgi:hypothetical protein
MPSGSIPDNISAPRLHEVNTSLELLIHARLGLDQLHGDTDETCISCDTGHPNLEVALKEEEVGLAGVVGQEYDAARNPVVTAVPQYLHYNLRLMLRWRWWVTRPYFARVFGDIFISYYIYGRAPIVGIYDKSAR